VAAHEPVSAEVAVGDATVEDVVGGDQDRVAARLGRLGRAAAAPQPLVLRGEVGVLGSPGGLGCPGQVRAQPPPDTGPYLVRDTLVGAPATSLRWQ
jgi:hypothetical protein